MSSQDQHSIRAAQIVPVSITPENTAPPAPLKVPVAKSVAVRRASDTAAHLDAKLLEALRSEDQTWYENPTMQDSKASMGLGMGSRRHVTSSPASNATAKTAKSDAKTSVVGHHDVGKSGSTLSRAMSAAILKPDWGKLSQRELYLEHSVLGQSPDEAAAGLLDEETEKVRV